MPIAAVTHTVKNTKRSTPIAVIHTARNTKKNTPIAVVTHTARNTRSTRTAAIRIAAKMPPRAEWECRAGARYSLKI